MQLNFDYLLTTTITMNSPHNPSSINNPNAFGTTDLSCFIVDTFLNNTAIAYHSYNTANTSPSR